MVSSCPLAEYFKSEQQGSLLDYVEFADILVHPATGVQVAKKALSPTFLVEPGRMSMRGDHVLYHYCPKEAFDAILVDGEVWTSTRLSTDCDFGIGIYSTAKPPHSFRCKDDILRNNYPRATAKFNPLEAGYPREDRVAYCIPILVDISWTPSFPLTDPLPTGPCGRVLEIRDRYGTFDAACHDIWIVETKQTEGYWYSTFGSKDQLIGFFKAAEQGDADYVAELLQSGVSVSECDTHGRSALMASSRAGHNEVVEALLSAKAHVNAANASGRTALMLGAYGGHTGVVSRLIAKNAHLDIGDKNGRTALMWAAKYDHEGVAKLLLEASACVEVVNRWGWTAKSEAEDAGNDSVICLLATAQTASSNNEQLTALFIQAAQQGRIGVVSECLDKGVAVNAISPSGWTALHEAAHGGHVAVVELLVEANADIDAMDPKGLTALMWASCSGHVEVGRTLLTVGARTDITDANGNSALIWSQWRGHDAMTKMLASFFT